MAYSSSSSVHHALSDTETAPIERIAAKAIDPLGQVAHRDAHAVALLHAEVVHQRVAEGVHFAHDVVEGPLLVLVDEEGLVDAARGVEELAQRRGRVLEDRDG